MLCLGTALGEEGINLICNGSRTGQNGGGGECPGVQWVAYEPADADSASVMCHRRSDEGQRQQLSWGSCSKKRSVAPAGGGKPCCASNAASSVNRGRRHQHWCLCLPMNTTQGCSFAARVKIARMKRLASPNLKHNTKHHTEKIRTFGATSACCSAIANTLHQLISCLRRKNLHQLDKG